jgi:hypothetical protein
VTLADVEGVKTFSVGEGADRRVTVASADAPPGEPAPDASGEPA